MLNWILRRPSRRQLFAEIERQSKMIDTLSDPKLIDMELKPGGLLHMNLEPGIGAKALAASFADMIDNAPNWASFEIGPFPTSYQGTLLVTVKRMSGHTPEAQVAKAKEIILKLLDVTNNCIDPDRYLWKDPVISEATAFVAPIPTPEANSTP